MMELALWVLMFLGAVSTVAGSNCTTGCKHYEGFGCSCCPTGCRCNEQFGYVLCTTGLTTWPVRPGIENIKRLQVLCYDAVEIPHIKKSDFEHYQQITRLEIINCAVQDISDDVFELLTNVTYLSLHGNKLSTIHQHTFSLLSKLDTLLLFNNRIEEIPDNAFIHLKKLKILRMTGNQIKRIGKHAFEDLPHLNDLLLEDNPNLTYVDEQAFLYSHIDYINIGGANLDGSFAKALQPLKDGLTVLYWMRNLRPVELPEDAFKGFNFTSLYMPDNKIPSADFLKNTVASTINLDDNNIKILDFANYPLPTTSSLFLRKNLIEYIDANTMSHLKKLQDLRLDDNNITEIVGTLNGLDELKRFIAPRNKIKSIPTRFFTNNQKMELIDFRENKIQNLDGTMFNTKIEGRLNLEFGFNQIKTVASNMEGVLRGKDNSSIEGYIHLFGNPLHCNCELKWLKRLLLQFPQVLTAYTYTPYDTNCTFPRNVDFILEVDIGDLVCQAPTITSVNVYDDTWQCAASGDPAPTLQWTDLEGRVIVSQMPDTITADQVSLQLDPWNTDEEYLICMAINSVGQASSAIVQLGSGSLPLFQPIVIYNTFMIIVLTYFTNF